MTDQFTSSDITNDDKLWCALSYVFSPLIPVILLLMEDKKNRPFIKYHAVQALAIGVIMIILVPILAVPTFGCGSLLWFVMFYWAYKAYQGLTFEIPVITNFIKSQGWV